MGGASIPYLLGTEIPNSAVREKTQALGASWNVVWAFVTNYIIPYMIADLHFKVPWIFGSVSLLATVFTFFFLPETKVGDKLRFNSGAVRVDLISSCFPRVSLSKKLMRFLRSLSIHSAGKKSISRMLNSRSVDWKAIDIQLVASPEKQMKKITQVISLSSDIADNLACLTTHKSVFRLGEGQAASYVPQ